MWILVVITLTLTGNATITKFEGFTTEQQCLIAAKKLKIVELKTECIEVK